MAHLDTAINVRLSAKLVEKLDAQTDPENGVNRSDVIRKLLKDALSEPNTISN